MSKYSIPIPRSRGMGDPEKLSADVVSALASGGGSTSFEGLDSNIRDLIIHAAICRIAFKDDSNHEFYTQYDEDTQIVDIDIPDQLLDNLMRVEVGPKLERYFSWLTNGVRNLRRDMMQFTIGADPSIATGMQGIGLQVGYDASIERVDVLASPSGSVEIDIWKVPADDWPGNAGYSMVGSQPVSISAGNKNINIPISSWDNDLEYGDILVYNVNSASSVQLVTVTLYVCRYSIFESNQT